MNANNIINKLNNIKLEDLQSLDYKKLFKDLLKRPDIIVNIAIVLLTAGVSIAYFQSSYKKAKSLNSDIPALEKKIKIIEEYNKVDTDLKDILNNLPEKITEAQFIDFITNIAMARSIQINSFSPATKYNEDLYDSLTISFSVTAKDYQDLWLFTYDIENSRFPIRIDSWSAAPITASKKRNRSNSRSRTKRYDMSNINKVPKLNTQIEVSLIDIKDE